MYIVRCELPPPDNTVGPIENPERLLEGLALGWRITADRALEQGRIVQALPQVLQTDMYFHILTPKAARPRKAVRQFVDWLAAEAR